MYTSETCNTLDSKNILEFYKNYRTNGYRIVIGPTCLSSLFNFANITSELNVLQFNILSGSPYDYSSMIDLVSRSPRNIAENILAVMKGFDWKQIAVVYCPECYTSDDLASENYFFKIKSYLEMNGDITLTAFKTIKKGIGSDEIAKTLKPLSSTSRVIFSFFGNNLDDYTEYLDAFRISNFTMDEFVPVIFLSKYSTTNLTYPWTNNPAVIDIFDKVLMIYNNVYQNSMASDFLSKYSFSTQDEAVVSMQLYEAYIVLGHYLYTAVRDPKTLNYLHPELDISKMKMIEGPLGNIYFNNEGQRLAGFDVVVFDKTQPEQRYVQKLGKSVVDGSCNCLAFYANSTFYEPNPDIPMCGYDNEKCSKYGVLIAIVIFIVLCFVFVIAYVIKRQKVMVNRGRSMKNPWLIPINDIRFIDLSNTDGSQHLSIQSLQRKIEEKKIIRTKRIATVDQTYILVDQYKMKERVRFDKTEASLLYQMKTAFQHDNINSFFGISLDKQLHIYLLWNQCFRGSLADIVLTPRTDKTSVNNNFQGAFVRDILKGMEYLHSSALMFHGSLTSMNCMIDAHWILKLSGFGTNGMLMKWNKSQQITAPNGGPVIPSSELHYYAPEILKLWRSAEREPITDITPQMGKAADMYSFGVVLFEIMFNRKFVDIEDGNEISFTFISEQGYQCLPEYPPVPEEYDVHPDIIQLFHRCWNKEPKERADIALARKITDSVLKMSGSLVDQMMKNLEIYTAGLEELVKTRTEALEIATKKSDELLLELIPRRIADMLKSGQEVNSEFFPNATILYSDIVGFTSLCSESSPMEVVALLSGMYQRFDLIISQQNGHKMETIGDAYCVAAGLPVACETEHVKSIAMIALLQRDFLHKFEIPHRPGQYLNCRWGFNSGSVFAGVIGIRAPRYSCFGETVSIAAKMESSGVPDRIQMTIKSQQLIMEHYPEFTYGSRGSCQIEGIGRFLTYWLEGISESHDEDDNSIKQYHSHINEELEKIKKRENTGSTHVSTPELHKTDAARQRAMKQRKEQAEQLKNLIIDTPPSTSSEEFSTPTKLLRPDSTTSTIAVK